MDGRKAGYVMMTITRQPAGKLRKLIRFLAEAREFYLLQSVQIGCMAHSTTSQGVQETHSVAVKRPGRNTLFYCPV